MEKGTAFRDYAIHLAKNGDGCNYATIGERLCVAQRYLDEVEGLTLKGVPSGAFSKSGTSISTTIVRLIKP